MQTFFVSGREEEFQYTDPNTGDRVDFTEVLKADFQRNDDTPCDSEGSELSVSLDDLSEEDDSVAECPTPKGKDLSTPKASPSKTAAAAAERPKDQNGTKGRRSSKSSSQDGEIKRRVSTPKSRMEPKPEQKDPVTKPENDRTTTTTTTTTTAPSSSPIKKATQTEKMSANEPDPSKSTANDTNRARKVGLSLGGQGPRDYKDPETTKVLSEAAKRLAQTKPPSKKPEASRRQDVTFAAEKPSEIPSSRFEAEVTEGEDSNENGEDDETDEKPQTSTERSSVKVQNAKGTDSGTDTNAVSTADVQSGKSGQTVSKSQLITAGGMVKPTSSGNIREGESSKGPRLTKRRSSDTRMGTQSTDDPDALGTDEQSPVEKFNQMINQRRFAPMPVIPFRSSQAAMFRQLALLNLTIVLVMLRSTRRLINHR
ncbi:unnamed protein product [Echinostoma caproni]|uniref:Microtubule-associated protein futsch n=1 Tax=Echinostoma caproni TaxID=27848 RepID=A0A183AJP0_9TREM|nr:unnamed protein product [Echinostoma caproni]